jgi:hypothetical protein
MNQYIDLKGGRCHHSTPSLARAISFAGASARLPHDVFLVSRNPSQWSDLLQEPEADVDLDSIHDRIRDSEAAWVISTYLRLKKVYRNVLLTDRFVSGKICVVNAGNLRAKDFTFNSFVIGCRGDSYAPELCDFVVVENQANVKSPTDIYMPHWPQPGLIPRRPARGCRIETLTFKGRGVNLYHWFRTPEFLGELGQLGTHLEINEMEWNDYSTCDLVLAARDLTEIDALVKPPSKLINAWLAGVPALLGPEPAFRQLRRSELDYLEVIRPEDVIAAVRRLKEEPELFRAMIENGFERAKEYSVERMTQRWADAFSGPIARAYESWREQSFIRHFAGYLSRISKHKKAKKDSIYHIRHGRRILTGFRRSP